MTSPLSRRSFLGAAGAVSALGLSACGSRAGGDEPLLYVNSRGGQWEQSARQHLFEPFTRDTGIEIRTVSPLSFAQLARQVSTGSYQFDLTLLGAGEMLRAHKAELVDSIAHSRIETDRLWKGAVCMNGVSFDCFATVIGYRTDKFASAGPRNWQQFWDVQRFPGPRSLQRHATRVLPIALLADGVPVEKLYPLELDRAFHALDRIKPHIRLWWTSAAESQQLLRDGAVDLIGLWHGQVFELIDAQAPVAMSWHHAEIDQRYWVVARGSPRAANAWRFIESCCRPERQAAFARSALSSPSNPAAFHYIDALAARHMPTAPSNYPLTFEQDIQNFGGELEAATQRFEDWIAA
jgi:putative spermidine/putrescine transport system substrate-binding protein